MELNPTCPSCSLQVLPVFYFCPNCGKSVRSKPLSSSVGKQIGVYLTSIFVPPFGLIPGIKYLLQKDGKAKLVGVMAIILTIISSVVTYYLTLTLVDRIKGEINSQLGNQLNSQMNSQLQQSIPQVNQLPQNNSF